MATFRKAFRFLRSNASASLMFLIYILMWWMPLRPIITLVSGRSDIPYGINGPLEWMSRWWLTADAPTLFQPIALLGAWMLAYQRIGILRATWARTCRSAARRGAKWAKYSWILLAVLLLTGAVSFLGHITPLAISTLVWLPIGVVFYIYGPRVTRSLHTPILLLLAATAVPDTIPELLQKASQRILGAMEANLKHSGVQAAGCSVLKAGKNSDAVIGWAEALAWAGNAERGSTRAQGETAEVQSLLDGGMKPSIPNSANQTALHVGAALGGGGGWGEKEAAHAQAVKILTDALKTLKNGSTPAVAGAGGDWQSAVHAESGGTYYWDRKTNLTNWARPMAWAGASDCAGHSAGETLLLSGDLLCETKEISYAKQKRCQRDEKVQLQAKLDRLLPQDARQRGFKSAGHRSAGVCGRSFLNTLTDTINHVRKLKAEVSYRDVLMSAKTLVAMEVELQGDELVIQTLGAGAQDWFANAPWEVCKGILLRELVQKDHWSSLQQLKDALQASTVARSGLSRKNLWLDVQLSRFQTSKYISDQKEQTKPDATVMHRSVTSTSMTTSLVRTVEYVCAKLEVAISSTPEQQRTHKRKRMEDDTNIQVADVLDSPLASGSNALVTTPGAAANDPLAILLFNMPASWQWSPLQPIATKATREPGSQEPSDPSKTIGRWIHVESMSASSLPAHQESERVHVHKPRAVHALFCKRD